MAAPYKTDSIVGAYRILELAGADDKGTLYLAVKEDPNWLFWLLHLGQPMGQRQVKAGQELFEADGKQFFAFPVMGTTAAMLARLVRHVEWSFIGPRWVSVASYVGQINARGGKSYQAETPFALENLHFNATALLTPTRTPADVAVNPLFVAPEMTSEPPSPASDVYALGAALLTLLGEAAPGAPPVSGKRSGVLAANPMLAAVLKRATAEKPTGRFPTGEALARALEAAIPRKKSGESPPWVTGCVVPVAAVLLLALLAAGGFTFLTRDKPIAEATVVPTNIPLQGVAVDTGRVEIDSAALSVSGEEVEVDLLILQNGQPLPDQVPVQFTVIADDELVTGVTPTPLGEGRYSLVFDAPLEAEALLKINAFVGNKAASKSILYYDSDKVTGADFGTGAPPIPGRPGNAGGPAPINPPDGSSPESTGTFEGDIKVNAVKGAVSDVDDVVVQVDTTGYPNVVTYVTMLGVDGLPRRLAGSVEIGLYQDEVAVADFSLASVDPTQNALTVALVVDISGSMEGEPMAAARQAAAEFVAQLSPQDAACLYTFATQVNLVQPCTTDHATTISLINNLATVDDTALYDATVRVATDLIQVPGRKAVVILSDGADTASQGSLEQVLAEAPRANVPLHIIGLVSEDFDGAVLLQLAEATGGIYLPTPSEADLQALYMQTQAQLANQYRLSFDSLYPERAQGTITLRLKDNTGALEDSSNFFVQQ